jgi:hypothetical protein
MPGTKTILLAVSKEKILLNDLYKYVLPNIVVKVKEQSINSMFQGEKNFPVVYTLTLFMAALVAFCAFDPLFAASL